MKLNKTLIVLLLSLFSTNMYAQSDNNSKEKLHKFVIYTGIGPNLYFNNLVVAKQFVNELNFSIPLKIMWEPEHRLSLGIETGFYRLYTVNIEELNTTIKNDAIPISVVVSMKITKSLYVDFCSGQTILKNKVSSASLGEVNASTLSLGDFAGALGYRKTLNDKMTIGTEVKFFYASKLDDKNIALLFMFGYSL